MSKYIITENKLMSAMEKYLLFRYPYLKEPLSMVQQKYSDNVLYFDVNDEVIFKKYNDEYTHEKVKWEVNADYLYNFFEMFGEDAFIDFVKYYFNINLLDKGNKEQDFVFR